MAERRFDEVNEQLKDIPPTVPPILAGLAFLVTTFLSAFVAAYLAVSGDVKAYLVQQKEIRLEEIKSNGETYAKENSELHKAGAQYTKQLDSLLSKTQELSTLLSASQIKAEVCERTSGDLQRRVASCESQLKGCRK